MSKTTLDCLALSNRDGNPHSYPFVTQIRYNKKIVIMEGTSSIQDAYADFNTRYFKRLQDYFEKNFDMAKYINIRS